MCRLPGVEAVGKRYRHVMYWGGLRGAIALAIVLSLPAFEQGETDTPRPAVIQRIYAVKDAALS